MPADRQQNAHDRALATVAGLAEIPTTEEDKPEEDPPLPETEVEEVDAAPTPAPKIGRPRKATTPLPEDDRPLSLHREPSEDFFAYLQRIKPEDWSSSKTSGLYIYKKTLKGNVRLTDEPLKSPITLAELREQFYPVHGDGNYRVQFTTGLKHLTTCGENITFDASGTTLESSSGASFGRSTAQHSDNGTADAIKATSEMLKDGAKAAVEISKVHQMEHNRPVDVAGIITAVMGAVSSMQPPKHEDKTAELIMIMLQNQAKDAERRAEAAERRAEEQRRLDREEAERRERTAKEEAERSRDRDKAFFELMLKQAESKADSLNQMTGLLSNFIKVKNEIDDSLGGGPKGPWDLVGNIADGVMQHGPAIIAAVKGAPAQEVQRMQQMQNPAAPAPEHQPFYDMVQRLARYFGRDPQLYDGPYLCQMLEEEYGPVYSDMINQPKETILSAVAAYEPFGKAIMEHPQAGPLMSKIIDAIKFPDTMDDIFGGEEDEDKESPLLHGRARKINGKAKQPEEVE